LKKERDYYKQQSFDSQNVPKYKHELNDTRNQLSIQSINFDEIIKKEN
jgi:hypothetical protein